MELSNISYFYHYKQSKLSRLGVTELTFGSGLYHLGMDGIFFM